MATVKMSIPLPVSVDMAWQMIGGFNTLKDWHPAIETSELEEGGRIRRLALVGGGSIVERLETFNDNEHTYTYTIEQGPLPVANYKSTIRVFQEPGKPGCVVEWSSDFSAAGAPENEAVKVIQGIYQAGFDNLKTLFGG